MQPCGALIEIMNEDGSMARLPQLLEVAKKFDLKIVSIADLIAYRLREESIIERGVTVDHAHQVGDVPASRRSARRATGWSTSP